MDNIEWAYDSEARLTEPITEPSVEPSVGFTTDNYDPVQEQEAWAGTGFNTDFNADTQVEEETHSSQDDDYHASSDSVGKAQLEADSKDDSKINDYIDASPERKAPSAPSVPSIGPHLPSPAQSADDNDAKQNLLPEMPGLCHFSFWFYF